MYKFVSVTPSILKTLAYADIFDYPLKIDELWQYLISEKKVDKKKLQKYLSLNRDIYKKDGFYSLRNKDNSSQRLAKEKENAKKILIAKKIASYCMYIPSVKCIAVSGAVAMKNADKDDDIDLFVITERNKLFSTRLLLTIVLEFFGVRRKRNDKKNANKICLNMLLDEREMLFPKHKQDLYTAHEIVQMLPLYDRENTYNKFMIKNSWVRRFLPNAEDIRIRQNDLQNHHDSLFSVILRSWALEFLAKKFQLWYMKRHKTTEEITDTMLAFHPLDYRNLILKKYRDRVKKLETHEKV